MASSGSADRDTRILVVDDAPSILDAVSTMLRYEGYLVSIATNGEDALASVRSDPPSLIVLDVMLPDLDGIELTKRLRAQGSDMPILLLTARDALEDKVVGLDIGADDYVTKPFVLAELDYLIASRVGPAARARLLEEVERGAYLLESMTGADVALAHTIIRRYADLQISLADASIVVLAERHRVNDVLTLDERHFRVLKAGGKPLRLLPADA